MPTPMPATVMHVMAGILLDDTGRVLLAQRPAGKHLAGFWEFPGGKLEADETPLAALARELLEELGIHVRSAEALIRLPWRYGDRELLLDAWRVSSWRGEPRSLEAQPLQWMLPASVDPMILAPVDRVILAELRGPRAPL
jgi:8-oxo-dGTP diphosphatase